MMGPEMPGGEGSPADEFRKKFEAKKGEAQAIFTDFMKHAKDYQEALRLTDKEIEEIDRQQGRAGMYPTPEDWQRVSMINLDIDGEQFSLVAKHVCKHPYRDFSAEEGWENLLMAIARNTDLNRSVGDGTSWINVVPEEWHQRILQSLAERPAQAEGDLADSLEEIDFSNITPEDIIGGGNHES